MRLLTGENSDEPVVADIRRAAAARMPALSEERIVTEPVFRRSLANAEVLARNIRAKTLQYQQHRREQDEHLAVMLRQV